jgi:hypothetical protein
MSLSKHEALNAFPSTAKQTNSSNNNKTRQKKRRGVEVIDKTNLAKC